MSSDAVGLSNAAAVVTGGGSGIGRAVAVELIAAGASVMVVGRTASTLDETLSGLPSGSRALAHVADITDPEACTQLVDRAKECFGRVDILVNNAAMHESEWADQLSLDLWNDVIATNLTAPFALSRAVLPHMMAARQGSIVNIGSVSSMMAGAGGVAYTASKHALVGLTRQLAMQYGHYGIRANCVCPGRTFTKMLGSEFLQTTPDPFTERLPVGAVAQPEDVAAIVAYLASPAARFVTGATWNIDGGFTLGHFRGGPLSPSGMPPGIRPET